MTAQALERVVGPSWVDMLLPLFNDDRMLYLRQYLTVEKKKGYTVYPEMKNVFRTFKETPLDKVRVVVLGQDPYINEGQATGLAFAVPSGTPTPPSLRVIFQELEREYECDPEKIDTSLLSWANQGVLLLNTALTVRRGTSNSHLSIWRWFIVEVLKRLQEHHTGLIFVQWGKEAQKFSVNELLHHKLTACHPQSQNYGTGTFVGCGHFSKINEIVKGQNGHECQINWLKILKND